MNRPIEVGDIVALDAGTGKVLAINPGLLSSPLLAGFARIEVISVVEGGHYDLSGFKIGDEFLIHVSDLERI